MFCVHVSADVRTGYVLYRALVVEWILNEEISMCSNAIVFSYVSTCKGIFVCKEHQQNLID